MGPTTTAPDAERVLTRLEWEVVRPLDGILQGDYRSSFLGRGGDLADIRPYQPGDDVRAIDWSVTARMDEPYVRQYYEDREITAWLLLDLSPSVDFGTARFHKRDLLRDFAGATARVLTRGGNRVGALLYSGGVDELLPARGGRRQAFALVDRLGRTDRPPSAGATDLAGVLEQAARTFRRRSLIFVVSDFITAPGWEDALRRLARHHEVVAVWLHDPREEELPDVGPLVLEDAETGEQLYVDTHDRAFRARFLSLAAERRRRLERTFAQTGVDLLSLSTDADVLPALTRFVLLRKQTRRRSPAALPGAGPAAAPPSGVPEGPGADRPAEAEGRDGESRAGHARKRPGARRSPIPMLRLVSRGRERPA
jgi:uncharacterized protein (DUF58 family)